MNTLQLLVDRQLNPDLPAFIPLDGQLCTFGELQSKAVSARVKLQKLGVQSGSCVLLADSISPEFYACVMAVLSLGATLILVEPYLPLSEIEFIIRNRKPQVMIASLLGKVWAARVRAIRNIPHWISARKLCGAGDSGKLIIESVDPEFPGIITFTSGTTAISKGVVRTHAGLTAQNHAIRNAAEYDRFQGPDLAIFANLVLANLGMGRGTVFVPAKWKRSDLKKIRDLPEALQPETLSCGPAFLSRLIEMEELPPIKSIHVGGALTDCSVFEKTFQRFPAETRILHVYGSSEAEPVAFIDARKAVESSLSKGYIQTLLLGNPVQGIQTRIEADSLWVCGDHVCKEYVGNEDENRKSKLRDDAGQLWHSMGDRIERDSDGLWYQGRSFQGKDDFLLEQKIYSYLNHTACFVERNPKGELILRGEGIGQRKKELLIQFPQLNQCIETTIRRDRRHRARIDRGASR